MKKINIKIDDTNSNLKFNNDNQINKANNTRDENKQKSKNNRIIYTSKKSQSQIIEQRNNVLNRDKSKNNNKSKISISSLIY